MRRSALVLTLAAALGVAACGSTSTTGGGTGATTEPTADDSVAPVTEAPATDPPATEPPATEPPATEPPATEPPATEPPATEPPVTEPPATAPPATAAPTTGTAVIYASGGRNPDVAWVPLGWWDGSNWMPAGYTDDGSFVVPPAPTIASVAATSLNLSSVITGLTLGEQDFYCIGDEMGPLIDLGVTVPETPADNGYEVVAVTADWPLQPRPVTQAGTEVAEYASVGAGLLAGMTPKVADGQVAQVVRADLDGNGIEEVLVTYELITNDLGAEGDFSSIYVRYPSADGSVTDELLWAYVMESSDEFPTIGRATIAAVADLNGDGVMEVGIRSRFWESSTMEIFGLNGDRLDPLMSGGCGV